MKDLYKYFRERESLIKINEMNLTTRDFINPKHDYLVQIINKVVNGDEILLGKQGTGGVYVCKNTDIAKKLFSEPNKINSPEEFNNIMKKIDINAPRWTKIFKGQVSGYFSIDKNQGNNFEKTYIALLQQPEYINKINEITNKNWNNAKIEHVGSLNTKRKLCFSGNNMFLSKPSNCKTIGDAVADVKLYNNLDTLNLSLKFGKNTTFVNTGIKTILPRYIYDEYNKTGKLDNLSNDAKTLFDCFGIDKEKYFNVFKNYGINQTTNSEDDITKQLKSETFYNLLKDIIGYGYVLIININGNILYYDLQTEQDLENFIGNFKSAKIYYGGLKKNGKRIDIIVNTNNLKLDINIRAKDGGIIPTHFMANIKDIRLPSK